MMTHHNDEWASLQTNFPGNAMYRGEILKIICLAYGKFLEHAGHDASLKYYDVCVEIDGAGKAVEILFALKKMDEPINQKNHLIEILGFTFNFEDCGLVDVAMVR